MIFRPKLSTTRRLDHGDQRMHDVLDPDDGHAGVFDRLDELHELGAFGFGQPAGDFVEQQEPRRAGERPRQLKPLPSEEIERAGTAVGHGDQPGALENFAAGVHHLCFALAAAVNGGDQQVLEHGEIFERVRDLKRAPDACDAALPRRRAGDVVAVEVDFAAIRRVQSGDEVEQRRFAGAVRSDNAERFALRDFQMQEVDRFQRAERFCQIIER